MRRTLLFLTILGLIALFATGCPKKQTTPIEASVTAEEGSGDGAAGAAGAAKPVEEMPSQQEAFAEEPLTEGADATGGAEGAEGATRGTLPLETVFFAFDSDELSPDAVAALDRNATWMRANPNQRVLIEGHTDERGTFEYNLALGARRAESVRSQLIRLGIPVAQMETISFGEDQPADPGHDEAAWARNRRCEFSEAP
ncbi:MAG: peptidoglycan-associated lipoprotein Pal [Acidobacteria bacterium]|jgi:peptidoglycan-associated lipoprotein|nr:peptidoglycan-associated lipoprotein Pal [Acidobacteriota bacterium]MCU0254309.1 peptidoglycan-associated lipoprotein Pal [Acidobacteriota bacterium]